MKFVRDYLEDMLDHIGYLEAFTADGRDLLDTDIKTELAIRKAYEILGEIIKRLPESLLQQQPTIRWKSIKGMRDILIHQYDNVEIDILWDAVQDLPNLRAAVETMLANVPPEDEKAE